MYPLLAGRPLALSDVLDHSIHLQYARVTVVQCYRELTNLQYATVIETGIAMKRNTKWDEEVEMVAKKSGSHDQQME